MVAMIFYPMPFTQISLIFCCQLVLSLRTWASLITRSHVLPCSSRLHLSSQVYVEQVEIFGKLCQAYLIQNLPKVFLSLNLLTLRKK